MRDLSETIHCWFLQRAVDKETVVICELGGLKLGNSEEEIFGPRTTYKSCSRLVLLCPFQKNGPFGLRTERYYANGLEDAASKEQRTLQIATIFRGHPSTLHYNGNYYYNHADQRK